MQLNTVDLEILTWQYNVNLNVGVLQMHLYRYVNVRVLTIQGKILLTQTIFF